MGSIPFSISTPCLLVFKKVKKVLISGIPSKAKILVLVFGRGTSGTDLMMIAFPGDLPPRPECRTQNSEPTKGEVIGIGMEDFYESRLWQILSMIFPK